MDPLTHSALGATIAMAVAPANHRRAAALVGAIAGLLPDADVLIGSESDPLLAIEYHRHFTHAWIFQPVVALVAVGIVLALLRIGSKKQSFGTLYVSALAAAFSHPFCDGWTSYGTRLLWPFSERRISWDWVSVIDPLITLPLIAAVALCLWRPLRRFPLIGCALITLYLGSSVIQKRRATTAIEAFLVDEGIRPERLRVKPSFANIIVWRCLWEADDQIHCAAVRAGQAPQITMGESAPLIRIDSLVTPSGEIPPDSVHHRDLRRFAHFSDDWLVWHPEKENVLCDARYALLPDTIEPLWGIGLNTANPNEHVSWETFRDADRQKARELWAAIRGKQG